MTGMRLGGRQQEGIISGVQEEDVRLAHSGRGLLPPLTYLGVVGCMPVPCQWTRTAEWASLGRNLLDDEVP